MSTKRTAKTIGYWALFMLGMTLAVLHYLLEKGAAGLNWVLLKIEKLMFKLEPYEKDNSDRDSGC